MSTLQAVALGAGATVVGGVLVSWLTQRLVVGPAKERGRRAQARRQDLWDLAAAFDPVAWHLEAVVDAMGQDPNTYQGPSVPSVWVGAFERIRANRADWDREWKYALEADPGMEKLVVEIADQAFAAQDALSAHGWHKQESLDEVVSLRDLVTALIETARSRASK